MFCALLTSRYQVSVYRTNGPLVFSSPESLGSQGQLIVNPSSRRPSVRRPSSSVVVRPPFLAHLSQRLIGELIGYSWSGVRRRRLS